MSLSGCAGVAVYCKINFNITLLITPRKFRCSLPFSHSNQCWFPFLHAWPSRFALLDDPSNWRCNNTAESYVSSSRCSNCNTWSDFQLPVRNFVPSEIALLGHTRLEEVVSVLRLVSDNWHKLQVIGDSSTKKKNWGGKTRSGGLGVHSISPRRPIHILALTGRN
jgi:hypothetical protein